MTSCRCHFKCPFDMLLAADLGKIHRILAASAEQLLHIGMGRSNIQTTC